MLTWSPFTWTRQAHFSNILCCTFLECHQSPTHISDRAVLAKFMLSIRQQPSFCLNIRIPNQGDLSVRHAVVEWQSVLEQRANLELKVELEHLREQIKALQRQVDDPRSSQASRQLRPEQSFETNNHGSGEPLASRE
jgi:hypothetical protein